MNPFFRQNELMAARARVSFCDWRVAALAVVIVSCAIARAGAAEPDASQIEFFEKRIRPILVEHCFECHGGEKKIKGGLRLDSAEGWRKGGDSGPAIVPGKPEESLLLEALRSEGDLKMPPRERLPQTTVAAFEQWIRSGAPAPNSFGSANSTQATTIDIETGRRHWAYRAVINPPVPPVRDTSWPRSGIDRFILSRLETEGLRPASAADRQMLARRVYFDLVGLPPSPEEIDDFLADSSPEAWERLVDQLLDSPHFGERWGRHWLDVVRFAESLTLRGFILKDAWRYRDYVIEAFNGDLPCDQFLREQIAGDLLPARTLDERRRQLVATTVLMLGNTNLEEQDKAQLEMDLIDEQLDVIGRGLLGQTVTCARCHDHKFDPIPTHDYYALAGILNNAKALEHENVSKWIEVPLPLEPDAEAVFRERDRELAALSTRLSEAQTAMKQLMGRQSAAADPDVIAAKNLPGIVVDDAAAKRVGAWQHSRYHQRYIGEGYLHDNNEDKGSKTLTFDPELPESGKYEVRFGYTPGDNRAANVPVTVFSADGERTVVVDERETPPIDGRFVSLGEFRFERDGQSFAIVSNTGTTGHVIADAFQFLPVDRAASQPAIGTGNEAGSPPPEAGELNRLRAEVKRLEVDLKQRKAAGPRRPVAMTVVEQPEPRDLCILIRGNVHNQGEVARRGVLQVISPASASIPPAEGGRRQLAEWITSCDNPLTARVLVNRVWHWLFGTGLVQTTDNFGTTGEPPSHPELLDHLAATFVADGWSLKRLVRRIVTSRTYQLSVQQDAQARTVDPENRLLWRMNRRRLDAECLRDAMLHVSGALQPARGGPGFPDDLAADYGYVDAANRRSVYVPVFRNALPELFEAFDFADPSTVTGRRNISTVAPQALFLMNHPFVIAQSKLCAARLIAETHASETDRLSRAYRLILGRPPSLAEQQAALKYIEGLPMESANAAISGWTQVVQTLFATIDFRYLQ
jgi:hypothetical protein